MSSGKTYSEKLKDPRWQRRRLEILNRDNFTCQKCADTEKTLHVHHRWYKAGKEPWEYPDDILITLCESCHSEEEGNKGEQWMLVKAFLICGNFNTELRQISNDVIFLQTELGMGKFRQLLSYSAKNPDFIEKISQFISQYTIEQQVSLPY